MPRKGPASRREIEPDPVYQNQLVTQLINKILVGGKKALAERIVYKTLEIVSDRTAGDPVVTLRKAVDNARPLLETRSRRVGRRVRLRFRRRIRGRVGVSAALQRFWPAGSADRPGSDV